MTRIATLLLSLFAFSAAEAATVLITGASRGIGFEFAKRYAEQKWDVIATARSPEDDEALQALASAHSNVRLEVLDVTDHAGIDALATKLKNTPIDVLINNAGVAGGRNTQDFGAVDYSVFNDVMNINVL
ncbi:MAG: SDR family NAD(P)-dependent oxidoreductase, partial [Rhodospirillaceae bacterium]|nr:SDR family NAD(P)-dependent oxidoreductase [Rhodospirillaceae bacterium]